jgi:carbamoyl-phosphate synthase small subunit
MGDRLYLYLENGDHFEGTSAGYFPEENNVLGEVVFNTGMTGYQEIISDPSYCDQIITMTFPLIGNYGINNDDNESIKPFLKALIIHELSMTGSNWRSNSSLYDFLKQHKIPALTNIDTRKLTKIIRTSGSLKAIISSRFLDLKSREKYFNLPKEENLINKVSLKEPVHFPGEGKRIVMIDFGFKKNILTSLLQRNCDVHIVPWNSSVEVIDKLNPQGIVLTNGPGDPKSVPEVLSTLQILQVKYPIFGICMGHQLFALANGAQTEKLKFGHRGVNHPVKDLDNNRIYITSQNHGYTVNKASLSMTDLLVTQINMNDGSVEGLKHKSLPSFSVQYHPESSPGPEDTQWLFDHFLSFIRK